MTKKKAVLLGQYTNPPWHPLDAVEGEITAILSDKYDIQCTEDMDAMTSERLAGIDLFISCTDCWGKPVTAAQAGGLLTYVSGGGALLVIHNGISLQANYELLHLIGAKFTGHPPYRTMDIEIIAPEHDIVKGLERFQIDDEPYQFDELPYFEKTVLLAYKEDGRDCPVAWTHRFGLGQVVYLGLGHDVRSYMNKPFRQLIARSARWLNDRSGQPD